jgi:hypothetical protein
VIRLVLKALLPLATFVLGAVIIVTAQLDAARYDAASVNQWIGDERLLGRVSSSRPPSAQVGVVNCQPRGPVPAAESLQARLILLSAESAKAFFGSKISKSYYVLEVELIDRSSSGVVVTGLSFRDAKGNNIIPVSLKTIVAKVPRRLTAELFPEGDCLVPKELLGQQIMVPGCSGVRTRLFVDKGNLELSRGRLPTGLQLFGRVSETLFEMRAIQATY